MTVTVDTVETTANHLAVAREAVLGHRTTEAVIASLAAAAERWLAPDSPWRSRAVADAPATTGFSAPMIHQAIDLTFGSLTAAALTELVERELGQVAVLDDFQPQGTVQRRALGPRLITHILAGNIPAPGITSLCLGVLLRAGNLVKSSSADTVFPSLFAESLGEIDPALAALIAVCSWSRDQAAVTGAALARADAVVVYGDDRTITELRALAPPAARFLGYGHKISLAVLPREALVPGQLALLAAAAAFDASVYDQQGCLSPHVFYLEERGEVSPRQFAAALAGAMAEYQSRVPRGPLSVDAAARLATARAGYEFRAATDKRIGVWSSQGTNDWVVVYDDDPSFSASMLNRFVFVKPMRDYARVLEALRPFRSVISCVGLAHWDDRARQFAEALAELGVSRVCPVGRMQQPPLSWYHDGRPNLADLVRWTEAG